MSDAETREVQIGDQTYRIPRFKGLKAALAGSLMSRVMQEVPQLQETAFAFRKHFRENNTIVITPAMAKLPRFEALGLTAEDFAAVGGNIEFPEDPDSGAVLIHVFPQLFELANKELQKFFAILVIPNSELFEADDADDIDGALNKWGKRMMREGDVDELLELVMVGVEVFKEQMASKRDRLGKLRAIPWLAMLFPEEETEQQPQASLDMESNGHGPTSPTPDEENQSPSPSSVPPLSSDAVDGDSVEETSSTEPLGASSS